MTQFSPEEFGPFFSALHGRTPFPWQSALAARVCTVGWPDTIDLPTASGKTACIDIALFALLCRDRAPRRIFFVVDRRVIVDEAFERMRGIATQLGEATEGILGRAAERLCTLAGESKPLHVCQLRGGIYRDESWVRNPRQPTIVASTVDQVGSRLLFRGYGVSGNTLAIHAGMIGNDALILLDEAHCSRAFGETLLRVQGYRNGRWASRDLGAEFRFVQMTATPAGKPGETPFGITDADRRPERLGRRLTAPKPAKLVVSKVKADDYAKLGGILVDEARKLIAQEPAIRRIAIMANRVATARAAYEKLERSHRELVIGRMRPVDRDDLAQRLKPLKSGEPRSEEGEPFFVVSTQCLEVGADLDFDALVTECASMDALLQRFGRLDRLGQFGKARACIVCPPVHADKPDAVYGEALAATRRWLEGLDCEGGPLNFALEGEPATVPQIWKKLGDEERRRMTPPAPRAAALLPAHLDTLVQTSPRPEPEPSVAYFLHGREPADADVQVLWRADLDENDPDRWSEIVQMCPPVSAEALPVKLWTFRNWMRGQDSRASEADVEGAAADEAPVRRRNAYLSRPVLVWRGEESFPTGEADRIRPGDTIVLPAGYDGAGELGHVPSHQLDIADRAFFSTRRRVRIRLHESLICHWPGSPKELIEISKDSDPEWSDLRERLSVYRGAGPGLEPWLHDCITAIVEGRPKDFQTQSYPGGLIVEGSRRIELEGVLEEDGDADERSAGKPITLAKHTEHVREAVTDSARALLDEAHREALDAAALWHDAGKQDPRFQALLHGGDTFAANFAPEPLAKGRFVPRSRRPEHWARSGLPPGFRHELHSLTHAREAACAESERDLMLHLIASHHGRCRPFAPVVIDSRHENDDAAHHLSSGVAERFWKLTRTYGWWGLAYLEALFRLSDWKASEDEQKGCNP